MKYIRIFFSLFLTIMLVPNIVMAAENAIKLTPRLSSRYIARCFLIDLFIFVISFLNSIIISAILKALMLKYNQ